MIKLTDKGWEVHQDGKRVGGPYRFRSDADNQEATISVRKAASGAPCCSCCTDGATCK